MFKNSIRPTLLFLLLPALVSAQSKKDIEHDFTKYMSFLGDKNFRASTEYLPDAFFELYPKEQMIMAMEATLNDPTMEMSFSDTRVLDIGDLFEVDNVTFSILSYSSNLNIRYFEVPGEQELGYVVSAMRMQYGIDAVSSDPEKGTILINATRKVCAIYENDQWKFLEYNQQQSAMIKQILPDEVITKLSEG